MDNQKSHELCTKYLCNYIFYHTVVDKGVLISIICRVLNIYLSCRGTCCTLQGFFQGSLDKRALSFLTWFYLKIVTPCVVIYIEPLRVPPEMPPKWPSSFIFFLMTKLRKNMTKKVMLCYVCCSGYQSEREKYVKADAYVLRAGQPIYQWSPTLFLEI